MTGLPDLIPVTVPEVRRLLARLVLVWAADAAAALAFSEWRRRHQARAKRAHYHARHGPQYLVRL